MCGNTISGAVEVFGSTGLVLVGTGGAGAEACSGNTVRGPIILGSPGANSNTGGIGVGDNIVSGPVIVSGNKAPTGGATQIEANHISGSLLCTTNAPPPVNDGEPNIVTGTRYGQCSGL